ncbi:MAG: redox-sensing transcriptional repressor Rex [Deltaproteobacteria bacterium]|jgi:redox-sensing transcriptional repressor|nr:redox-sensing transcriptional repressor Rex [Deltaproteobacteria bacterium]
MPSNPKTEKIPRAAIQRLAMYLQTLERMGRDGVELVSSEILARACAVNPSQIRRDLTYFGEFGVRGVGYNIGALIASVRQALHIDRPWDCALVGVGNLGRALLNHREFRQRQYNIVAAFDSDPNKIGLEFSGLKISSAEHMSDALINKSVQIGIITTPPEFAQRAVNCLIDAGVRGILNFASAQVFTSAGVFVENVDFFNHLYALSFNISMKDRVY